MSLNFYTFCVIYLVYSFLGWVGETVVATAKGRRFTNRGVASGPFCFVYGTAGVLITIGLNDQRTSLAALFFGSMIYATVVEWLFRTDIYISACDQRIQTGRGLTHNPFIERELQ